LPAFNVKEPPGVKVEGVELRGEHRFVELLDAEVYEGTVTILVHLSVPPETRGRLRLVGELTYYPCSDVDLTCFEQTDDIQAELVVADRGRAAAAAGSQPSGPPAAQPQSSPLTGSPEGREASPPAGRDEQRQAPEGGGVTLADRIGESLSKSLWLAYVLIFAGGILASFTPCVYPMIPITIAVIGAGSAGSKTRGFRLSLIYVLGIAITYSVLGAAAAGTGKAFGSFTQTFPVLLGIGALLLVLGAAMFGFFEVQPPAFMRDLQSKRGQGLAGVFVMGAVTGLVASPCLGPVLIALLAWIAKTGDVLRGFTLLFVFAAGMGVLLIVIGTFSGMLTALPKSGNWMIRVKEALGAVLAAVGVYYVALALAQRGVPERATWAVALGAALAVLGFVIRGIEPAAGAAEPGAAVAAPGIKAHLRKGLGVVTVVIGAYLAVLGLSMGGLAPSWVGPGSPGMGELQSEGLAWFDSYDAAMEEARRREMPVMIDFYADWCAYCKKLDSDVFSDSRVRREAERFVAVKVDADRRKDLVSAHKVLGLPTVVFLDSEGAEAARLESYVKADKFLALMRSVE